jgi:hypothetical protein
MKTKFHKSTKCPICGCTVIVRKHKGLAAKLLKALALANHARTLHPNMVIS